MPELLECQRCSLLQKMDAVTDRGPITIRPTLSSPSTSTSGALALKFLIAAVGLWFPTPRLNFLVKILSGVFGCSR